VQDGKSRRATSTRVISWPPTQHLPNGRLRVCGRDGCRPNRGGLGIIVTRRGMVMTPSGIRGVLNDALSIYFLDTALGSAFVARWCAGHRIVTAEGVFRIRADEPAGRIGTTRIRRASRQASRAHPLRKPGFSTFENGCGIETDSPLEGDGFEPSVPGTKEPVFVAEGELRDRTGAAKKGCFLYGTDGSNPSPSSSESSANPLFSKSVAQFTRKAAPSLATDGSAVTPLRRRPAARPSQPRPPRPAASRSPESTGA
jgi:hypothetical protein